MGRIKRASGERDGGRFAALPYVVLDSPAFLALPAPAVRLLLDMARQYTGANNGRLVVCHKYLASRGWKSHDTATRARRELEAAGLIVQTRTGMRPNRAAWFALTWLALDWTSEMEISKHNFSRGAYAQAVPPVKKALARLPV